MALTTSDAYITVDGQAPSAGDTVQVERGAVVTLAFASTKGLSTGHMQVIAPGHPTLHQKSFDWQDGQSNSFALALPDKPIGPQRSDTGVEIVSMVSDHSGGAIPSSHCYLQTKAAAPAPPAPPETVDELPVTHED